MLTEFNDYMESTEFDPEDLWSNWDKASQEKHSYMVWELQYMKRCRERSMFSDATVCAGFERAEALADMAAAYWKYEHVTKRYADSVG